VAQGIRLPLEDLGKLEHQVAETRPDRDGALFFLKDGMLAVIRVEIARLPRNEDTDALVVAALQGLPCAFGKDADGTDVVLGLDAVTHPCRMTRRGELSLLPMALDSVVNTLRQQTLEEERARLETRLQRVRRLWAHAPVA
jgi:hypothetical protein